MHDLKRILIWLKRFRYRCGYGVHSPFAFDFITNVIYEKAAYYAYREIEHTIKNKQNHEEKDKTVVPAKKVNRLLFRLVNRVQPQYIIDLGGEPYTSYYLQAGKKTAHYVLLTKAGAIEWPSDASADFLHINDPGNPVVVKELFECAVGKVSLKSVFAIQGIYHSKAMEVLWKQIIADERVGITFDLYDLGILFFDKSKLKQHYVVNF